MKILVTVERVVDYNVKMSMNAFNEISVEGAPIFQVADLFVAMPELQKAL